MIILLEAKFIEKYPRFPYQKNLFLGHGTNFSRTDLNQKKNIVKNNLVF